MTIEEVIEIVRALLGNIPEEELPDAIIKLFYNKWSNSLCGGKELSFSLVLYYTIMDCVRWLMAQEIASGNSSIRERFEKIGDETISVKGGSSLDSWKDFLDFLEKNPEYVDPCLSFNSSLVIIGGVRKDEFFRVKNNPNSYNGFMEQGVYPTKAVPHRSRWNNSTRRSPWQV
ncbi:hypothetical protein POP15_013 [Pectobacterium phage POP15]|nr:hypothetical protein POP15_013 [Pectobacterium phage POP15]